MEPISYRVPGLFTILVNGSVVQNLPASSRWIVRSETSHKVPKGGKKRLHLSPLPYHFNSADCALTRTFDLVNGATKYYGSGPFLSDIVGSPVWMPTPSYAGTYSEALDQLNEATRGNLDLSIDLLEANQTRKMFNAAERVKSLHKAFFGRYRTLKLLANHWLEFTYGVKPLMGTVFGIADEMIRRNFNYTTRFKGRGSEPFVPEAVRLYSAQGESVIHKVTSSKMKISTTLGADLRTGQFDLDRWSSLNPLSIAWELTPYSFVADWFLDVGGYLRNAETSLLYANQFRSGYRTDLLVGEVTIDNVYPSSGPWTGTYIDTGKVKYVQIDRTPLTSYPAPYLPSFKAKLGSSRLLSAASLLAGHLPKR